MTTLFERIQTDRRQAMKERKGKVRINLLGVLIADASSKDKSPNDDTVIKTIRSTVKRLKESQDALKTQQKAEMQELTKLERGTPEFEKKNTAYNSSITQYYTIDQEMMILNSYLPKQVSEEDLAAFIESKWDDLGGRDCKTFGLMMKEVRNKFGNTADMKLASKIAKEAVS